MIASSRTSCALAFFIAAVVNKTYVREEKFIAKVGDYIFNDACDQSPKSMGMIIKEGLLFSSDCPCTLATYAYYSKARKAPMMTPATPTAIAFHCNVDTPET
jgi:hypothetical protein